MASPHPAVDGLGMTRWVSLPGPWSFQSQAKRTTEGDDSYWSPLFDDGGGDDVMVLHSPGWPSGPHVAKTNPELRSSCLLVSSVPATSVYLQAWLPLDMTRKEREVGRPLGSLKLSRALLRNF